MLNCMRTTLDIDDDVLQAAKELASVRGRTAGQTLSDLARAGLQPRARSARVRNGVPLLPPPAGRRAPDDEARELAARRRVNRIALLDVNVLVALFDPDHVHHDLAHDWFAGQAAAGWATCPVTENGYLRVLANPVYGTPMARPEALLRHLRRFCAGDGHHFWPDAVSLRDEKRFDPAAVAGTGRSPTYISSASPCRWAAAWPRSTAASGCRRSAARGPRT